MISAQFSLFRTALGQAPTKLCARSLRRWPQPTDYKDVVFPENRKLPILEQVPHWGNMKPLKMQRRLYDMQGPELIHNTLMYNQYGIIALSGGQLKHGHLNMIRMTINKAIDTQRMFAVWRVDAPWKPVTKKGQGKRMGGGKGSINHYVTPVRAGRIIVELGGTVEFEEILSFTQDVVWKLPFDAMVINRHTLQELYDEREVLRQKNMNPLTYKYLLRNNVLGSQSRASPYDYEWSGEYI